MLPDETKTLGEKAAFAIIELIKQNHFRAGDKLPNEYELSESLGVSRNTVREALKVLASRNIVMIRQGAGTFISEKMGISDDPLGFSFVEDRIRLTKDLLQIRSIIEPPIAALAAQNATKKDIKELEKRLLEVEDFIEKREDFTEKDTEFHTQIAKCAHNIVMSNLIPVIAMGVTVFSEEVHKAEYENTINSHRRIYEAIRDGKPVEAKDAMTFHLLYSSERYRKEVK